MENSLSGKTIVVTGATSGIGLAVTEASVSAGAFVIGIGHSLEHCREAEKKIRLINPQAKIAYLAVDLSLQKQVRSLEPKIREILIAYEISSLDGLVNNAGTFTFWQTLTAEGFEMQWAVNHLAPFLITRELLPLLKAAPGARIVTVSSESHRGTKLNWDDIQLRRRYNGLLAYQQTKLANVLFTLELNRYLGEQSTVHAFAADPGLVKTDIGFKGTPSFVRGIWGFRRSAGVPPEEAARGIMFLLTEPELQNSSEIYWKGSLPNKASAPALDLVNARRLWTISEQMVGLEREN